MALECAHCGNRCDDGATRCPKCLRTTHLVPVAAPPPKRSPWPAVGVALGALVAGGGAAAFFLRRPPAPPPLPANAPAAASDPLAAGEDLAPLVARARAEREPVARARLVAAEVHRRRAAALAGDDEPTPPPRAPSLLWRVLPDARERVTELDLARLVAAALRAAGDPAAVAERTAPPRPDDALDPTGARGSYVVTAGDHVVEPALGTLVGRGDVRHRPLAERALVGAVSAQAALELADAGADPARAIEYANAAVDAWPDSPHPLAARARVWLAAGGSGGLDSARNDLRAAVAVRDDAALHLLLARVALVRSDLAGAVAAASRAASLAPGWGSASAALLALHDVALRLDAGAPDGCARLRTARAPWTDDAYALCAPDVAADVRTAAARRLLDASRDPLRVALAAAALPATPGLVERVGRHERRELAAWLLLLGRADLLAPGDGGAP